MNTIRGLNITDTGGRKRETIIFLHGFMGSREDFKDIISAISSGYRCIAIDLPGHGNSLFSKDPILNNLENFSSVAELIAGSINSMGIKRYFIYGYSMGGRVAQNISLLAPENIKGLIIESSSFGISGQKERHERYKYDLEMLKNIKENNDLFIFLKKWHRLPMFITLRGTPHIDKLINKKMSNNINELKKAIELMSLGNQPFFLHQLKEKRIKINYLYGEADLKYRDIALRAKRSIPSMKLFPVAGASHNIHIQHPEKIVTLINKIISNV